MSPIPAAAGVMSAMDRFARESDALLRAMSGAANADPAAAIVAQREARAQLFAGVQTIRIADEMLRELLSLHD